MLAITASNTNAQVKDNLSFSPIIGIGHTTITGKLDQDVEIHLVLEKVD